MPLWNTPQSGYNTQYPGLNCVNLNPGDDYALLNGTELVATGTASVHFSRGSMGDTDAGTTFVLSGCPNSSVIKIQGSNGVAQSTTNGIPTVTQTPTNLDASFISVGTITGNGVCTDTARFTYYRAIVDTFMAGDVPVLIAKR